MQHIHIMNVESVQRVGLELLCGAKIDAGNPIFCDCVEVDPVKKVVALWHLYEYPVVAGIQPEDPQLIKRWLFPATCIDVDRIDNEGAVLIRLGRLTIQVLPREGEKVWIARPLDPAMTRDEQKLRRMLREAHYLVIAHERIAREAKAEGSPPEDDAVHDMIVTAARNAMTTIEQDLAKLTETSYRLSGKDGVI